MFCNILKIDEFKTPNFASVVAELKRNILLATTRNVTTIVASGIKDMLPHVKRKDSSVDAASTVTSNVRNRVEVCVSSPYQQCAVVCVPVHARPGYLFRRNDILLIYR